MQVAVSIGATDQDVLAAQAVLDAARPSEVLVALAAVRSPKVLHLVASAYNWDDGFEIPFAILRSPLCDFGTALMLFWHAEPTHVDNLVQAEFLREARRLLLSRSFKT